MRFDAEDVPELVTMAGAVLAVPKQKPVLGNIRSFSRSCPAS